ncbi:MAG: hypothetical protein H6815_02945 [Phycisphaeraceae bacterium]|nr:hypothetical protein [Phycisphaerales bacterium]MCB9859384.1 hypothetical protein [Phycisphaeraceae bacterium]
MNIIAVVEYVRAQQWRKEQLAIDLVLALVARGHHVTLLCDAIEDTSVLEQRSIESAGSLTVRMHRPNRKRNDGRARSFAWWARTVVQQIGHDAEISGIETPVVISLTPTVCGQVWLPIARDPRGALTRVLQSPNPLSMGMELARERSEFVASIACTEAMRAYRAGRILHALPIGAEHKTQCSRLRIGNDKDSVAGVGFISPLSSRLNRDELVEMRQTARARLRAMLSLAQDATLLAMSLNSHDLNAIDSVFAGVALIEPEARPILVITGSMAGSIDALACKHGISDHVRLIGPTNHMELVLLGSHAALHPGSIAPPRAPLGRFLADATFTHTSIIAGPNASGRELAENHGVLVDAHEPGAWRDAIASALHKATHLKPGSADVSVCQTAPAIEHYLRNVLKLTLSRI